MSEKYEIEYDITIRVEYSTEPRDPGAGFPNPDLTVERVILLDHEIELSEELRDAIRKETIDILTDEEDYYGK